MGEESGLTSFRSWRTPMYRPASYVGPVFFSTTAERTDIRKWQFSCGKLTDDAST